MKRSLALVSAVLVASFVAIQVPHALGGGKKDSDKNPADTKADVVDKQKGEANASLRQLMSEKVEIPEAFQGGPVPLKIVLKYLTDTAAARGHQLQIALDK